MLELTPCAFTVCNRIRRNGKLIDVAEDLFQTLSA
ncbi:hypothetical protein ENSA7_59280 [Enhygromyxa salina]|uniref:Uncharacterized protein n=1 Tax=Enhygromyxa salina TaxID=215803 RepID=A0A2S9Y5R4_9BACT|nr:hypothetical protein ENSA7_59280 [Enhygromyxa salina]